MDRPIVIHSLSDARAALAAAVELGRPLVLTTAPGAAGYAGVGWFGELVAAVRTECPGVDITAVLDCGDAAGHVMEAVRWCAVATRPRLVLRFTGDEALEAKLRDIAEASGLLLIRDLPPALDLARAADAASACGAWLLGMATAG